MGGLVVANDLQVVVMCSAWFIIVMTLKLHSTLHEHRNSQVCDANL